ncbi:MAG: glycosyltransferase family 39 protein [Candidatus Eremiobacteraeota bacterium]|nr:glycosyltransferase family 39 protein [Candidatus Eremiobacteraeota bacterium]
MKKYIYKFFLVLLGIIICLSNFYWLKINNAPPAGDANSHLILSMDFYYPLVSNDLLKDKIARIFFGWGGYPPLVYWLTSLFYGIVGVHALTPFLAQSIFIFIFLFSMFNLGRLLWDEKTGMAMAFVSSATPFFLHYSRSFLLDFPLLAMVCLCYYLYFASRNFQDRKYSILLGIALGLGMLTKWSLLYFMLVPMVYSFVPVFIKGSKKITARAIVLLVPVCVGVGAIIMSRYVITDINHPWERSIFPAIFWILSFLFLGFMIWAWQRKFSGQGFFSLDEDHAHSFINSIYCIFAIVLVAGCWYMTNISHLIHRLFFQIMDTPRYTVNFFRVLWANSKVLLFTFPLSVIFFLFGVGALFYNKTAGRRKENLLTLANLLFCIIVISVTIPFNARYILPALTFVIMLSLYWITRYRKFYPIILGFLILVSVFQVSSWALVHSGCIPQDVASKLRYFYPMIGIDLEKLSRKVFVPDASLPPDSRKYHILDVIEFIYQRSGGKQSGVGIYNNMDKSPLQGRSFRYYSLLKRYFALNFFSLEDPTEKRSLKDCKFVIMISDEDSDFETWKIASGQKIDGDFCFLRDYDLPADFKMHIYEKVDK